MVEDNETNRALLTEMLSGRAQCDEAVDGRDGFKKYSQDFYSEKKYQVILLDIAMPNVDGIVLLRLIRENEDFYNIPEEDRIPIIIITAHKERLEDAVNLGCMEHILKPVDPDDLLSRIEKVVKKK